MKYMYTHNSPVGNINILEEDGFLIGLEISNPIQNPAYIIQETPLIQRVKQQLSEYFNHKRHVFDLPLRFYGTNFQQKVWNELTKIPYGNSISYQELAKRIGNIKACRAVGGANNKNPIGIIVPCHRVIGKDGSLVGYAGGVHLKQWLLEWEQTK